MSQGDHVQLVKERLGCVERPPGRIPACHIGPERRRSQRHRPPAGQPFTVLSAKLQPSRCEFDTGRFIQRRLNTANLQGAVLNDVHLKGAQFGQAKLGLADLSNCDCSNANFSEAELEGVIVLGQLASMARTCRQHELAPMCWNNVKLQGPRSRT